jgi:hypothetical protein
MSDRTLMHNKLGAVSSGLRAHLEESGRLGARTANYDPGPDRVWATVGEPGR